MAFRIAMVVLIAAGASAPASASADKVIEAQIMWRFDAMSYTIDQGEPLTFRNADAVSPGPHNVTANDTDAAGRPLFASATIPSGEEVPVEGARALRTGSYGFICSVHPFMQATLAVTDKGTPQPGGPTPPASPPAAPTRDTRPPAVTALVTRTSLRRALRRRAFGVVVGADEPAGLRLRLTARVRRRSLLVGVATATIAKAGDRARVSIRVTRRALRSLRRARRATLVLGVEARDGAGNVGVATARRSVRR